MVEKTAPKFQMQLIPPFRFAMVEESLFRGAYPKLKNFRFLRRLRLKTIVSLTPEMGPSCDLSKFCESEGITIRHFYVEKFRDVAVTLTDAQVIQVLQILISPENLPTYVHCLDGAHVTGLVIMCLRKLENWNLTTSIAEFRREAEISREESQFLEAFGGEIKIPPVIPRWLWQGERYVKHPWFKLELLDTEELPKTACESATESESVKSATECESVNQVLTHMAHRKDNLVQYVRHLKWNNLHGLVMDQEQTFLVPQVSEESSIEYITADIGRSNAIDGHMTSRWNDATNISCSAGCKIAKHNDEVVPISLKQYVWTKYILHKS